jgi:hypothetical protein
MSSNLKRKAFFIDETAVRRAKKALGARTEAEAVRVAVQRVAEMEEFWQFMRRTHGKLQPGSFETS